jgi:hypothetical protein
MSGMVVLTRTVGRRRWRRLVRTAQAKCSAKGLHLDDVLNHCVLYERDRRVAKQADAGVV